jgi:hypothetical protein
MKWHRQESGSWWLILWHCYLISPWQTWLNNSIAKVAMRNVFKWGSRLVLATVPNSQNRGGLGLEREWNHCNRSHHPGTWTVAFRPVFTGNPGLFNPRTFAPIEYLSSHWIATWSICEWSSVRYCFTCGWPILIVSNNRCVAVETPRIGRNWECYFIVTQQILIGVQIGDQGVNVLLKLHLLRKDHCVIW